jgi:hypothetical protein
MQTILDCNNVGHGTAGKEYVIDIYKEGCERSASGHGEQPVISLRLRETKV